MREMPKNAEMEQLIKELNQMILNEWQNNFVLSGVWWILLLLSIVPWFYGGKL